jgi:hypothetical protein
MDGHPGGGGSIPVHELLPSEVQSLDPSLLK